MTDPISRPRLPLAAELSAPARRGPAPHPKPGSQVVFPAVPSSRRRSVRLGRVLVGLRVGGRAAGPVWPRGGADGTVVAERAHGGTVVAERERGGAVVANSCNKI